MTDKIKVILTLIFLAVTFPVFAAKGNVPEYGLQINTYPEPGDKYTTLSLDGGEPIEFDGEDFTVVGDVWLRPDNILGTVCRIITDNNCNVDLLYGVENDMRYPMLVVGENAILQQTSPPVGKWVSASLSLSPSSGEVTMHYNGYETKVNYPQLKGARSARIDWGFCLIDGFGLGDVASISIKDVVVVRGDDKIRHWKLQAHNGDICYDEVCHKPATAVHPKWIIDNSVTWKKIFTTKTLIHPSVAFDPVMATFYYVGSRNQTLYVFHSSEGEVDSIPSHGGKQVSYVPDQLIYFPAFHRLLSFNISDNLFSFFDPISHIWSSNKEPNPDYNFWNNSILFNPADSTILSFGGYGHYRYNNLLVRSYPFSGKAQSRVPLEKIDPRRSSSTAIVDGYLYIYGGWGSHSGRQELSAHSYFDMYRVNLADNSVEQLWHLEKSPFGSDFVGLENMIYDRERDCFYLLSTLENGVLLKINPDNGEMERMSLSLGFVADNHMVYGNLFYSPEQKKLYAAMVSSDVHDNSELSIYELAYPPVALADLSQPDSYVYESTCDTWSGWSVVWIIIGGVIAAGLGLIALLLMRRRRGLISQPDHTVALTEHDITETPSKEDILPETVDDKESDNKKDVADDSVACQEEAADAPEEESAQIEDNDVDVVENPDEKNEDGNTAVRFFFARLSGEDGDMPVRRKYYDLTKGCIKFFGGFQAFDKDGNDITGQFSPILKNLLVVLVLYSDKNSSGISNNRLLNFLWRGKDEASAKNSRNVYISRLRSLLTKIGDISIIAENSLRSIEFGKDTICDYLEAQRLLREGAATNIEPLLELLFNGMMLPNMELDFIDAFKSEFSDKVIELLNKLIRDEKLSIELRLKIANTLFQYDYCNEDALFMKCQILHFQGRTGMAQSVYNFYCKEYRSLMGEEYPRSFSEIINKMRN